MMRSRDEIFPDMCELKGENIHRHLPTQVQVHISMFRFGIDVRDRCPERRADDEKPMSHRLPSVWKSAREENFSAWHHRLYAPAPLHDVWEDEP